MGETSWVGVSARFTNVLIDLYNKAKISIQTPRSETSAVPISQGVLQGEPSSSLLFALLISDIVDFFIYRDKLGIQISILYDIIILAFAGDLVFLADSALNLIHKLKIFQEYCDINRNIKMNKKRKLWISVKQPELIQNQTFFMQIQGLKLLKVTDTWVFHLQARVFLGWRMTTSA